MKVLVVGTGGMIRGSGITTMADQLTRTLEAMGHDAVRVELGTRPRRRPNRLNPENIRALIGEMTAIVKRIRVERPCTVWLHVMGAPLLPAVRTLLLVAAVRCARSRAIVHLHAFDLARQVHAGGRSTALVLRATGRLSLRMVALHDVDAVAIECVTRGTDVRVLPNWVDVPRSPAPMPPGPPWVAVFVGGLVARKGLPQLIEAMRSLKHAPVTLRLVGGPGDEGPEAAEAYRAAASDLVAAGAVVFVGEVDRAGVVEELRRGHLLVLPSTAEGTPMALLEALAQGRPAIVSGAIDPAGVIQASGAVLLPSNDPALLAQALERIVEDSGSLPAAGHRAWSAMLEHASPSRVAERVSAILPSERPGRSSPP